MPRIVADRLLERGVFLATEQIQTAHRGLDVGPREHRVRRDLQVALDAQRRRRIPARRFHDRVELFLRADQCDVERVARMVVARFRDPRAGVERRMVLGVNLPALRNQQIGREQPDHQHDDHALHNRHASTLSGVFLHSIRSAFRPLIFRPFIVAHRSRQNAKSPRSRGLRACGVAVASAGAAVASAVAGGVASGFFIRTSSHCSVWSCAEMDQRRRFILGEIIQSRLDYGIRFIARR